MSAPASSLFSASVEKGNGGAAGPVESVRVRQAAWILNCRMRADIEEPAL